MLVLQSWAYSQTVFENRHLKRYMVREHEKCCAHARDILGLDISPEEIILIDGWVKSAADWASTAFSNYSTKTWTSVQGQAAKFGALDFFKSRMRVHSGPRSHRQGSSYPRPTGTPLSDLPRNQCLFLSRYKVKKRLKVLVKIEAGAGYDELPRSDGGAAAQEGVRVSDGGTVGGEGSEESIFKAKSVS